jgi:hypothetical protein
MNMTELTETVLIELNQRIYYKDAEGELVVLNGSTGAYFVLNEVGADMFKALVEHKKVESAVAALLVMYEVDEEQIRTDLCKFITDLEIAGLVVLKRYGEATQDGNES